MSSSSDDAPRRWVAERREEILAAARAWIAIDSVTGREGELARACARWCEEHDLEAQLQACKGRWNLVVEGGRGPRTLVLAGHLDTVPPEQERWSRDPWEPAVVDGKLYGLGASDIKASLVGCLFAQRWLVEAGGELEGRLVSAFTIEEETSGDGTRGFLDWALGEGFLDPSQCACVVTEPTGFETVALGNRGTGFVRLRVEGLGGHGSRPHLARNPLGKLLAILGGLEGLQADWSARHADPDLGGASLTPTSIAGGSAERVNGIPDEARAVVDCRLPPALYRDGLSPFARAFEEYLETHRESGFEIEWELLHPREGHRQDPDHPVVRAVMGVLEEELGRTVELGVTEAGNDAVFFGLAGVPTVNKVGPGHVECAHRSDEYVRLENLYQGVEFFIRLARRYLA